jgi:hypothetical protein
MECIDGMRMRVYGIGRSRDDVGKLDEVSMIWNEWLVVGCDGRSDTGISIVA